MAVARAVLVGFASVVVVALIAGCAPTEVEPKTESTAASTPSATPTAEAEPEAVPTFIAPADCAALIGPTLEAEFADQNIVLFDSTLGGGLYTDLGDHAPLQTGGATFYCLFGQDMVDLSSFQLEAQALTPSAHEAVTSVLDSSGLVKGGAGDVVTYTQTGDDRGAPTLIHVLRPDSWMTAWSAFGGDRQVFLLTGYLDQMAAQNYPVVP